MQDGLLIGLTGVKGSGKSTVANMLAEIIPDIEIVAWADALKDEVADMVEAYTDYLPSREDIEALKAEVYGPLCQGWGAFRRHQHPEYWIDAWDARTTNRVIVPDCRHHNEVDHLKENDGILIAVIGPSRWEGDTRSTTHESERYVSELRERADYFLHNEGNLDDLRADVTRLARLILMRASLYAGLSA